MKRSPYINAFSNATEYNEYVSGNDIDYPNIALNQATGDINILSEMPVPSVTSISFTVFNGYTPNEDAGDFEGYADDVIEVDSIYDVDPDKTFSQTLKSNDIAVVFDNLGNYITNQCTFNSYDFVLEEDGGGGYAWKHLTTITEDMDHYPEYYAVTATYTVDGATFTDTILVNYTLTCVGYGEEPEEPEEPEEQEEQEE